MTKTKLILAGIALWFLARRADALNITDAFKGGVFDRFAGSEGINYNLAQRSVEPIISNIIVVALSFLGGIFVLLMVFAGFTWMTAAGNEKKVATSKELIVAAVIGLIIVVAAYAITLFVIGRVVTPDTLNIGTQ